MKNLRLVLAPLVLVALVLSACSGGEPESPAAAETTDAAGVRVVSADEGAAIHADPPEDLVVLDVRTPEEFAASHIEGAILVDIAEPDFADRIAELDRDAPYLLYCRSGNRSQAARELMDQLGFVDVADVDGGIVAWADAGHPVVTG